PVTPDAGRAAAVFGGCVPVCYSNGAPAPVVAPLSLHDALPICGDMIVLGGYAARAGAPFIGAVRARVRQHSLESALRRLTISTTDRKSTRLNSSHVKSSYAVFRLKKKT